MKVEIIDGCNGCSLCASICPTVFRMGDDNTADVFESLASVDEALVTEPVESGLVNVIIIK